MASQQGNIDRFVKAVKAGQYVEGERFDPERENETPFWNVGVGSTAAERAQQQQPQ
jgi:hypothetical protein